jgi:hypothetical protein
VKLYKGGIPAQYGGRASSILDVKMKEGNSKKLEINGGIGVIFSRFSIEAPIIKDKASFIFAARRSYIDILAKPFLTGNNANASFNFYDLTAKVNYNIRFSFLVILAETCLEQVLDLIGGTERFHLVGTMYFLKSFS